MASAAISAGIGGGAFFTPLFNVLLQFSIQGSAALSQAAIMGAGLSGVGALLTSKHALKPHLRLVNFEIALLLAPFLLLGVGAGER